jgi:predicted DNA-binding protein
MLRLDPKLARRLEVVAEVEGRTVADVVREAIANLAAQRRNDKRFLALLQALLRQRPLRRGNQQVALAAMLQFLALNGWQVDPNPPKMIGGLVVELAAGTLTATALRPDWRPALTCTKDPSKSSAVTERPEPFHPVARGLAPAGGK